MLYFFLELEVLWLLMMFLKINNAINYVLQFEKNLHSWNLIFFLLNFIKFS